MDCTVYEWTNRATACDEGSRWREKGGVVCVCLCAATIATLCPMWIHGAPDLSMKKEPTVYRLWCACVNPQQHTMGGC